ncbi:hypothetical protein [Pedobacter sp. UC225_65]
MIFTLRFDRSTLALSSKPTNKIKEFKYNQIMMTINVPIGQ